jgi:hypothetical protein
MINKILHTIHSSKNILVIFGIYCFLLPHGLAAQVPQTTPLSQGTPTVYKIDTRSAALADATIADPLLLSSMNINPAAIAFTRNFQAVHTNLSHEFNSNLSWKNVTLPVLKSRMHTIAMQVGHHGIGLDIMNPFSGPDYQAEFNAFQFDVAYAISFQNVFSIGLSNNVSFATNPYSEYWTTHLAVGMLYAPSQSITYGAAFRGIGRTTDWKIIPDGRTGIGSQDIPNSLELGATLHFPVDTDKTWLSVSLANEKRFGEKGIWYKAGVETYALPWLAIRTGMLFHLESPTETSSNIVAPRMGLGINKHTFSLDYSFSPSDKLPERFHQIGISFGF